ASSVPIRRTAAATLSGSRAASREPQDGFGASACATRVYAGRAWQPSSHAFTFGYGSSETPTSVAYQTTDATITSVSEKLSPRRFGATASFSSRMVDNA